MLFNERRENLLKKIYSRFQCTRKIAQYMYFRFAEKSGDNHPKHFRSILEIIKSVISSPFVKAEADLVEYLVLFLKRYLRLP
jgi:hypothetical protein